MLQDRSQAVLSRNANTAAEQNFRCCDDWVCGVDFVSACEPMVQYQRHDREVCRVVVMWFIATTGTILFSRQALSVTWGESSLC